MKLKTALALGRVSNLPTVWTNVLAGVVLAGGALAPTGLLAAMLSMSSFYVGGMYLNDAFDRDYDARHQAHRPIPSGQASARAVFAVGFGLLALGLLAVMLQARVHGSARDASLAAMALSATIVFYNVHHKGNPLSPLVMGLCRVLVYVAGGLMLGGVVNVALSLGGLTLLAYLIALTFIAKRGAGAKVVGRLLAGICVVDACALLLMGQPVLALIAALGFPLTRAFHRAVAGT